MRKLGLDLVRIGEFSWSRLEPQFEQYDWAWLDTAINTLSAAGLGVILCTPTACPPAWLIKQSPDILPQTARGDVRGFGSRRHYAFSSSLYREQCARIVTAMLDRYGNRTEIIGWQIDNEFGCHDTTFSYDDESLQRFREWLRDRYGSAGALNDAWGTVFWSQEYARFDEVGFPGIAVTESNPAHTLAYRRFASDEVKRFGRHQASLVRDRCGKNAWLTHNFMGNFTDFDHYNVAADLDIASWDSYPLGFLQQSWFDEETKSRFRRTGHPDWAAFHHDMYRGVGRGRMAVMEQQPGPVNWADRNAAPLPGMVRLWSWEAIAHGAEFVSYFRWQQYPKAQEQMHSALNLPTGEAAAVQEEIRLLADELSTIELGPVKKASVALVFDYASCWITDTKSRESDFSAFQQAFEYYSAARSLGLDIDIVPSNVDFSDYRLVLVPAVLSLDSTFIATLRNCGAQLLFGPRSGSKTMDFSIPKNLAPGPLQSEIPLKVVAVDSIREGVEIPFRYGEKSFAAIRWLEKIETGLRSSAATVDGDGIYFVNDRWHYINAMTTSDFLRQVIGELCDQAGLESVSLSDGLRLRRRGSQVFAFNYGPGTASLPLDSGQLLRGERALGCGDVAISALDCA